MINLEFIGYKENLYKLAILLYVYVSIYTYLVITNVSYVCIHIYVHGYVCIHIYSGL